MEENIIELQGIFCKGYGFIAKVVMQDNKLSLQAKGIYAYLCSYSGKGKDSFPSRKKMCFDLNISNDTLGKYLNELKENGYIAINQSKNENNKFANNIYTINLNFPCTKISDTENSLYEKVDTNKNINNKNINYNNNNGIYIAPTENITNKIVTFYNNNIGAITPYAMEVLDDFAKEMDKELIILAMKKAVEANIRTIQYIKGILNNWSKKGIKTIIEAQKEDETFKNKKDNQQKKTTYNNYEQRQYNNLDNLYTNLNQGE